MEIDFLDLINKTREKRQLYIHHGTVLKADLLKEAADDFDNSDPMMVLMECICKYLQLWLSRADLHRIPVYIT